MPFSPGARPMPVLIERFFVKFATAWSAASEFAPPDDGREVLDVEREPPGAGKVERAAALGRIEAQAAAPLGAAHAQPDGVRSFAHDLRAVDGDEAAG